MTAFLITLFLILFVALAVAAVVVVGMKGYGGNHAPRLAGGLAETARHMNGEGEPPQALIDLLPETLVPATKP
ncbi:MULTISPECIES: hypothetical protein [unclassified Luteococcus]|uniref:hypothetical protein n=1 Tax=unclassified Luteococcus TaxID=2639923 RepID=UPI00313DE3D3